MEPDDVDVDGITERRAPDGALLSIRISLDAGDRAYHNLGYEIEDDGPVFDYHNVPGPWESNDRYGEPEAVREAADKAVADRYGAPTNPLDESRWGEVQKHESSGGDDGS